MKVQELVDYMRKNTNRIMKEDQVASLLAKTIEPKTYISIKDKRLLVDKIIDHSIYYDNGMSKFDGIERYMYFTMYTIEACTNIELSDDIENDFDTLSESKLLPAIICLIQQEFDDVNVFLQMQCDYVLEGNSIESQVGKLFADILEKVDVLTGDLSKLISGVDMDKLMGEKDKILKYFKNIGK